jgi:hypothetical protein
MQMNSPVEEAQIHLAEVVVGELASQPLEARHEAHPLGSNGVDQGVERVLATSVSYQLRTTPDLHRDQIRLSGDLLHQSAAEGDKPSNAGYRSTGHQARSAAH